MARSLKEQLSNILDVYAKDVTEQIKKDAEEVAKETVDKSKQDSPKRTGKYKRGWKVKKVFENANEVRYIVYNTRYRLTHLLEKGHAKKDGGRVAARVHIRPAELWAQKEFMSRIEKAVKQ